MTPSLQPAHIYTDVQSLDKLKYGADKDSPETLRFVAEQFEAIFLQMMLKSAHGESDDDGLFGEQQGGQTEFYQDWHDKQMAINLASGKGVGIAEMLVKQLQMSGVAANNIEGPATPLSLDKAIRQAPAPVMPISTTSAAESQPVQQNASQGDMPMETPAEFAQHLWPHARQAAEKLGVAPEVILAQAALETGWGQKVSRHGSGESSHNLFNIKADGRWSGKTVSVPTLEYRDGIAVRETAQFRAYDSFAESFADFVDFIKTSPRYQSALAVAADARSFTRELSAAGYATDPEYSSKIMKIADGAPLQDALAAIKI
jgi:flagellar protein FlgJ